MGPLGRGLDRRRNSVSWSNRQIEPLRVCLVAAGTRGSRVTVPIPMPMIKRSFALLILLLSVLTLSAAPASVEGFTYVKSLGGIDEYRLDANGLQILLMPEHS